MVGNFPLTCAIEKALKIVLVVSSFGAQHHGDRTKDLWNETLNRGPLCECFTLGTLKMTLLKKSSICFCLSFSPLTLAIKSAEKNSKLQSNPIIRR